MAGARKLQAEIDRTLKRIEEGIQAFDDQLDRVKESDTQAMKEKNEEDLKKEIKKLQRYRDAIKIWLSSAEVKQKQPLIEARSLIERRMETFKVVERETKTKAYSREGLARDSTLTAEEKRRLKTREWVQDLVQSLSDDIDATEAEIEAFEGSMAAGGSAAGGKAGKAQKEAQLAKMNGLINNHRWHMDRLEALTRMLDNETVDPDDVDAIKEDLEYYMEQAKEDGFELDAGLYDSFEGLTLGEGTADDSGDEGRDDDLDLPQPAQASSATATASSSASSSSQQPPGSAVKAPATSAAGAAAAGGGAAGKTGLPAVSTPAATGAGSSSSSSSVARTPSAASTGAATSLSAKPTAATPTATASSASGGVLGATASAPAAIGVGVSKLPVPGPTVASAAAAVAAGKASGAPAPSVTMSPALPQSKVAAAAAGVSSAATSAAGAAAGVAASSGGAAATGAAAATPGKAPLSSATATTTTTTTTTAAGAAGKPLGAPAGGTATAAVPAAKAASSATFPSLPAPQAQTQAQTQPTPQQQQAQPSLASIVRGTAASTPAAAASATTSATPAAANAGAATGAALQQQQQAAAAAAAAQQQQQQQQMLLQQQQATAAALQQQQAAAAAQQQQAAAAAAAAQRGGTPQQAQAQAAALLPAGLASSAGLAAAIAAATTPAPSPSILDTSLSPIPLASQRFNIASLQLSLAHIPESMDSERPKQYVPRNAAAVHAAFPSIPATGLDPTPALFGRLESDTLFFVFYYMQNTHAQYLAARELRRQGWRYSNRTCTFYRRAPADGPAGASGALAPVEEVTAVGPDGVSSQVVADKGSFAAFEYESGWVVRTKRDLALARADWADRDTQGQLGLGPVPVGAIGGPNPQPGAVAAGGSGPASE